MSPGLVIAVIAGYFLLLIIISLLTGRNSDSTTFFTANRQSPWYLVAFGMIGASLSGVTFISIPGEVGNTQFSYFQVVLGYLPGYFVIGAILMPLYYRLNLVSIYTYLERRFGFWSYKTGAFFFLLSRLIGSSFRLFLVASVLQFALFDKLHVPFEVSVAITIALIWLYTFRGGIKTIVFTDTLQTFFMLVAVGVSVVLIARELDIEAVQIPQAIAASGMGKMFFWDNWNTGQHFLKQFLSGVFIAIVMTGLDQDMMQKNLTCRSLGEAQKNMIWFSLVLVVVNLLFLGLGALLFMYAQARGIDIPERTDHLYPLLALNEFPLLVGVLFLLGITAAAYSSADSALTALTTSFCVDFLNFEKNLQGNKKQTRLLVHVGFSVLTFLVVVIFQRLNDASVISMVFKAAGFTYGPLLGLYAHGLFTRLVVHDRWVLPVCIASPILSFILDFYSSTWFGGFKFGFFILIVNGLLTFLGLLLVSRRGTRYEKASEEKVRIKVGASSKVINS